MTGPRRFRSTPSAPRVAEGVPVAEGASGAVSKRIPESLPRHPAADDVYYIGGAWAPACITAQEKRFTTAELFAQYWFAQNMGHHPTQAATLYRFACLGHFDEEAT